MKKRLFTALLSTTLLATAGVADRRTERDAQVLSWVKNRDSASLQKFLDEHKLKSVPEFIIVRQVAMHGTPEMMEFLDSDLKMNISKESRPNVNALHIAAQSGNIEMVRFLIEEKKFALMKKTIIVQLHCTMRSKVPLPTKQFVIYFNTKTSIL